MKWSMPVVDLTIAPSTMTFEFVKSNYGAILDNILQPVSKVIKGNQTGEHIIFRMRIFRRAIFLE